MGKEVVFARDTPNFIANRIGVFIMLESIRLMQEEDLTIEEVDALTGTAIGWPRTGTFRLADLVGLDVMAHVAANFARLRSSAAGEMAMPPFIQTMLERRWLGDKTKQGFYKKEKDAEGKEVRLALDWKTLEYHPAAKPKLPSLEMAKNAERLPDRLRQLLSGDVKKDKAARFHWRLLERALELCRRLPARDRRRCGQRRSRHARRLQLGNGPVRAVGRGRRAGDRRAHGDARARSSSRCSPRARRPGIAITGASASIR